MTDKEILQGIDRLDAELPFDEICVGGKDNWHDIDVHELLYEVRERIKWHYPSRGEYPTEGEEVFCCLKRPDGFVKNWYETGYYNRQKWSCNVDEDFLSELLISGYKLEVIAWQYIEPPKEEA